MGRIHFLANNDIASAEITAKIKEACNGGEPLFLCGNQSIKELRLSNDSIASLMQDRGAQKNVFSHIEFLSRLKCEVHKQKHFLSTSDCRYILLKVIERVFSDDSTKQRIYKDVRYDLYELFDFLAFSETEVSEDVIKRIGKKYTTVEQDIFSLYRQYVQAVGEIVRTIRSGEPCLYQDMLGTVIQDASFDTYHNKIKSELSLMASRYRTIFLDGFLFFEDIHKFFVAAALETGAEVYLIVKNSTNTELNKFLYEQNYLKVFETLGTIDIPAEEKNAQPVNTALQYLKSTYPDIRPCTNYYDNSIEVVEPFTDRDSELRYVASRISEYLREYGNDDIATIRRLLADVAVVVAVNKDEYEDRISTVLRDVGVFVFMEAGNIPPLFDKAVIHDSHKLIYYNRREFLSEPIIFDDNSPLTYEQKFNLFNVAFESIEIGRAERPIASYPIGQFVFHVYDILVYGISIDSFKSLLYSNWQYHAGSTKTQWDRYISEFQKIEAFFEEKDNLDEWIEILRQFMDSQADAEANPLLKYHPLANVKNFSIVFFYELLCYLRALVNEIGEISGSLQEHVTALKHKVMGLDMLLSLDDSKLSFEQTLLKKLYLALDSVGTSSIMGNIDALYFAENIRYMLNNWNDETVEETDARLRLDVIKLVNVKKYKRVFFIMLEAGKYPRSYTERFPYTRQVMEILGDPKYGIGKTPLNYYTLDVHLKIEKYHFINVLDFTEEQLTFTMCDNDNGSKHSPSIYVDDVGMMLGDSLGKIIPEAQVMDSVVAFNEPVGTYYLESPQEVRVSELLEHKLCPKLFFYNQCHRTCYQSRFQLQFYFTAVLISETLNRFKQYNRDNKKVYSTRDTEATKVLLDQFPAAWEYCSVFFPLFNVYEMADIKEGATERLSSMIPNLIKHNIRGKNFTIIAAEDTSYQRESGYKIVLDYDAKAYDIDNKVSRIVSNDLFVEFLVLKTSDSAKSPEHYAQMVAALESGNSHVDRINLTFKMIGKINRQFVSRFINDGWERTDDLISEIRSYNYMSAKAMPGKYCTYCRINRLCMAEYESTREN